MNWTLFGLFGYWAPILFAYGLGFDGFGYNVKLCLNALGLGVNWIDWVRV